MLPQWLAGAFLAPLLATLRVQLEQTLAEKDTQINLLRRQIKSLEKSMAAQPRPEVSQPRELKQLKSWVAQLQQKWEKAVAGMDQLPRYRQSDAPRITRIPSTTRKEGIVRHNMHFGVESKLSIYPFSVN